jgi:hypothetical protein
VCFALFDVRIRVEPHHWWERIVNETKDWAKVATFKLTVGESCVVKPSYVEQLKNVERYKVMYTRTAVDLYVWLDNLGGQGTVGSSSGVPNSRGGTTGTFHDTDFSTEHWEKLAT